MTQSSRASCLLAGAASLLAAGITISSPAWAKTHEIAMTALETDVVIDGSGEKYAAWTFNGQMPGPVVRVSEGDTINFTLTNPAENKNPHAMDFHAAEIDFLKNYRAINAGETIGATAGKVVATAKRTATAIGEQKERAATAAAQVRSETRRVVRQGKREARKAVKSAKKVAASARKSIKRVAKKLKRR